MKVYNEVVIDIASGEVLSEDSFEYEGPIAECGGGAGEVDFPLYMKAVHTIWLNHAETDTGPVFSMTQLLESHQHWGPMGSGGQVQAGLITYDPDDALAAMGTVIDNWEDKVEEWEERPTYHWANQLYVKDLIEDYSDLMDTEMLATTYPRFEAGMRDINAVMSSAFVIGKSNIEAQKAKGIAAMGTSALMQHFELRKAHDLGTLEGYARMYEKELETLRITIAAKDAEYQDRAENHVLHLRWDFDAWAAATNLLGGIGGGTRVPDKGKTKAVGAVGGAISGAVAGAQIGGSSYSWYGAAAGAVIGGVAGYLGA